jgi:hypothetical protein
MYVTYTRLITYESVLLSICFINNYTNRKKNFETKRSVITKLYIMWHKYVTLSLPVRTSHVKLAQFVQGILPLLHIAYKFVIIWKLCGSCFGVACKPEIVVWACDVASPGRYLVDRHLTIQDLRIVGSSSWLAQCLSSSSDCQERQPCWQIQYLWNMRETVTN